MDTQCDGLIMLFLVTAGELIAPFGTDHVSQTKPRLLQCNLLIRQ